MLAKCDEGCGETFTVRSFNVERLGSGIERTHFICPHCRHDYTCFYTNAEIRKLHKNGRHEAAKVKMIALKARMEAVT